MILPQEILMIYIALQFYLSGIIFLSRTLKYIDHQIENVEILNLNQKYRFTDESFKPKKKKSIAIRSLQKISQYLSFLKKNDKVFIKESYLGTINQFILELKLKQIPIIWQDKSIFFSL